MARRNQPDAVPHLRWQRWLLRSRRRRLRFLRQTRLWLASHQRHMAPSPHGPGPRTCAGRL